MANQFNVRREDGVIKFDQGPALLVGETLLLNDDEAANLAAWLGTTVDITGGRNFEEWQAIMREQQG